MKKISTIHISLILGGILAGYLFYNYKKNLPKKTSEQTVNNPVSVDLNVKTACEKEWVDKIGSVSRFTSKEAMQSSKDDYVNNCVKSN